MRHASNYVCFPCRRTARAQRTVRPVSVDGFTRSNWWGSSNTRYGPDPKCPGCGNAMLSWRGPVPTGKGWDAREEEMIAHYIKWTERRSPFHPQHWKWKYGYAGYEPGQGLIQNPCAPKFFQALQKPVDSQV